MKSTIRLLLSLFVIVAFLVVIGSGCRAEAPDAEPDHAHEQEREAEAGHDHDDEAGHEHGGVLPELTPVTLEAGERLRVVATTSIVADVVAQVGGEQIDLTRLMPLGADPHAFEPTPRDAAAIADAHVVFVNGAGLETFIDSLLESAGDVPLVPVSAGIELLPFEVDPHHGEDEHHDDDGHHHEGEGDPHLWFDPNNVLVWVHNIEETLSALDPQHAGAYHENAEGYEAELEGLDGWIRQEVARIPEGNRVLVTDHASLTYFADRYGFRQVGAVIPATTTLAESSARELAALQEAIGEYDVPAIFVGRTVNPRLAEQVAADTGVRLVSIYTGSLSEPEGSAPTYLDFMRYNVAAIVEGLR